MSTMISTEYLNYTITQVLRTSKLINAISLHGEIKMKGDLQQVWIADVLLLILFIKHMQTLNKLWWIKYKHLEKGKF